ncbi:MAG: phosphatase domain-containing protein [Gemmatimonadota bacterium]
MSWTSKFESLIGEIDHHLRDAARSILGDGPQGVIAYRGYGNHTAAYFHGRALECRTYDPSAHTDSALRNLLNTYRRVDANAIPLAQVAIEFAGRTVTCTADDEGFFAGRIDLAPPLEDGDSWRTYAVELLSPAAAGVVPPKTKGEMLVPPSTARFGVISDIDDTVIQSRVNNFLQAARTVMLGNARTRLPFPGVAAFYDALSRGADGAQQNPIFYVSSSPWNIHDIIVEFMDLQGLPRGPILLRDWDIALGALAASRHFEHKGVAIRRILALYPDLPFILIGDTSQHDPEIYRQIVSEFPGRISAVYIRDVNRSPERTQSVQRLSEEILAAKSVLVLAENTVGAATHAIERGWISADALPSIRDEKRADEGTSGEKVATPDGGAPGDGNAPTVVQ